MSDETLEQLHAWLAAIGRPAGRLEPLAGDVSRRAYHRAHHDGGATSIVATYPPEMTDVCRRFARTTALLAAAGVRVPRLLERDCARGRSLLEDAGERTLFDRVPADGTELAGWIERAADVAARFRALPRAQVAALNPPLDGPLFRRELAQTWELLLVPQGLAGGDRGERERLRGALDAICDRLDAEPRVPCHRDFMARNLIPGDSGALFVLDHQDLRLGPEAYDLASLLNDSFFAPADLEARLVERHLAPHGGLDAYRRCVVQRALKACGTFAAFARRGSSRHLRLVPPTLERAADKLEALEEGRGLEAVIARWRSVPAPPPGDRGEAVRGR